MSINRKLVVKIKPTFIIDFASICMVNESWKNSEIYFKALDFLSLDASECIAIEDTEESAKSALEELPQCKYLDALRTIANYVVERKF